MKEIIRERFRVKHPAGMFYRVTNTKGAARESGRVRFLESVDFLTLFSVRQKHGAEISLSADSDQGFSPWTSAAFFSKNSCTKKILLL